MQTPQEAAAAWAAGVSGGGKKWADGVSKVTESPAQKAIARKDKWASRTQEAIADDRFAKGLQGVTLQSWQTAARASQSKFTGSAQTGAAKVQRFMQAAAPIYAAIKAEIDAMPAMSDGDMDQRMLRNKQLMRERLRGVRG
jgi:hypothetical protein